MQALKRELEAIVQGEYLRLQQETFIWEQMLMEVVAEWFSPLKMRRSGISLCCTVCKVTLRVRGSESDPGHRCASRHALFYALRSLTCPDCPGSLEPISDSDPESFDHEVVLRFSRYSVRCDPPRMFNGLSEIHCF